VPFFCFVKVLTDLLGRGEKIEITGSGIVALSANNEGDILESKGRSAIVVGRMNMLSRLQEEKTSQ
jgi:hypothetical protein